MTFTLIGMPGSGKSCMGRVVSRKLKMKLVDADKVIETNRGQKLQEMIALLGVEKFREIEESELVAISVDNAIISTGGSAVYYEKAMEHFKSLGKVIYLYVSFDTMLKRIGDFSKRGIVMRPDQSIRDVYEERSALYEKYADITINCDGEAYKRYQNAVIKAITDEIMKSESGK